MQAEFCSENENNNFRVIGKPKELHGGQRREN